MIACFQCVTLCILNVNRFSICEHERVIFAFDVLFLVETIRWREQGGLGLITSYSEFTKNNCLWSVVQLL